MRAPQQKHLGTWFVQNALDDGVGDDFPALLGMRSGRMGLDGQGCVQQQHAASRPAQKAVALLDELVGVFFGQFGEHITQTGRYRSEERRVGKECVSTCRSRWSPSP